MEELARQYARKILLIHLLLLVVIAAGVTLAARGVYNRAREQAIEQFLEKQSLLAQQTSNGIEAHYRAILSSLDILERDQRDAILPFRLSANMLENATTLVGHQLVGPGGHDRVAALMVVGRVAPQPPGDRSRPKGPMPVTRPAPPANENRDLVLIGFYPSRVAKPMQESMMREVTGFLKQADKPTIGMARDTKAGPAHVIAYPSHVRQWVGGRMVDEVWFVAVVPVEGVKTRFLDDLGRRQGVRQAGQPRVELVASLIDERGVTMASSDTPSQPDAATAESPAIAASRPAIAKAIADSRERVAAGKSGTISFKPSSSEVATIEPIPVADKTWFLVISSTTTPIDEMVTAIFRKALWWAVFLVATMTILLVSSSTSLIRSQLRIARVRNEAMLQEMAQARQIQLAWLPRNSDGLLVDIAAVNEPASHISGDFYDWFELRDGRIVITIGDVTGHGMSAAFLMATTQLLIRNTMMRMRDPGECLTEVNRQLCGQVFNGQFVTVCVMVLDLSINTLEVASAGHFAPMLHDGEKVVPLDADSNLVLGVERGEKYSTESFILPETYALLLYTDGVIDARSRSGEPFDPMRLRREFSREATAVGSIETLVHAVRSFRDGADLVDDLTLVVVHGPASSARVRPHTQQALS